MNSLYIVFRMADLFMQTTPGCQAPQVATGKQLASQPSAQAAANASDQLAAFETITQGIVQVQHLFGRSKIVSSFSGELQSFQSLLVYCLCHLVCF